MKFVAVLALCALVAAAPPGATTTSSAPPGTTTTSSAPPDTTTTSSAPPDTTTASSAPPDTTTTSSSPPAPPDITTTNSASPGAPPAVSTTTFADVGAPPPSGAVEPPSTTNPTTNQITEDGSFDACAYQKDSVGSQPNTGGQCELRHSACKNRKFLGWNNLYCAKSCCVQKWGKTTNCKGKSDNAAAQCALRAAFCNDATYATYMDENCAATCCQQQYKCSAMADVFRQCVDLDPKYCKKTADTTDQVVAWMTKNCSDRCCRAAGVTEAYVAPATPPATTATPPATTATPPASTP